MHAQPPLSCQPIRVTPDQQGAPAFLRSAMQACGCTHLTSAPHPTLPHRSRPASTLLRACTCSAPACTPCSAPTPYRCPIRLHERPHAHQRRTHPVRGPHRHLPAPICVCPRRILAPADPLAAGFYAGPQFASPLIPVLASTLPGCGLARAVEAGDHNTTLGDKEYFVCWIYVSTTAYFIYLILALQNGLHMYRDSLTRKFPNTLQPTLWAR